MQKVINTRTDCFDINTIFTQQIIGVINRLIRIQLNEFGYEMCS